MKSIISVFTIMFFLFNYNSNIQSMGFFNKIFGGIQKSSNSNNHLVKTSEMLDEDLYWEIIAQSLKNSKDQNGQEKFLIKEISKLTPKQMIGFRLRTDKLLYDTYTSEMWCASYLMNDGSSDDGFEYFRNWIISRGKEVYYQAKENPDTLISQKKFGEDGIYEFEPFWYVAIEAFKQKTNEDLYDYIDYDHFHTSEGNYPQFEFTWQETNPSSMKKICPNIFKEFNTQ